MPKRRTVQKRGKGKGAKRRKTIRKNGKGKRKTFRKNGQSKRKILVKRKFFNAVQALRKMKPKEQRKRTQNASKEFIDDITTFLKRLRRMPHLVKNRHRKVLKKLGKSLRKLVNKGTSVESRRKILLQRGGIIPFLIPIICASIGAAGAVGASAAGAAIMKS